MSEMSDHEEQREAKQLEKIRKMQEFQQRNFILMRNKNMVQSQSNLVKRFKEYQENNKM